MKFQLVKEGDYRAYSNPFTFWIFENGDYYDVVCHYGDSIHREKGNEENEFGILNKVKDWCHKYALKVTLEQLQEIAPEGGRTEEIDGQYKFVCNGAIPDMGYRCCDKIGHTGKCFSINKKVYFTREN